MRVFFMVVLGVYTLIYALFGIRIIQKAPLGSPWRRLLWLVLMICFVSVPGAIAAQHKGMNLRISIPLAWFAYTTFGFFTIVFPALLVRDAGLWTWVGIHNTWAGLKNKSNVKHRSSSNSLDSSRRLFVLNATNVMLAGGGLALTGYGVFAAQKVPDIRHVTVQLPNLPREFHNFRILQISDLHISMTLRKNYVTALVSRANALKPDCIVFTGDIADGQAEDLAIDAEPLADLFAPKGKYFVTGNHEYYAGVASWLKQVGQLGFVPLINEHRIIKNKGTGIVMAGITDFRAERIMPAHASNPQKALCGAPEKATKIMLAHQPKSIFQVASQGVDLMLCGHTHGGQYIPFNLMVPLDQPYVHGLHRHGDTQVYVSRGSGYWGAPIRVGAPSELTLLRLICV